MLHTYILFLAYYLLKNVFTSCRKTILQQKLEYLHTRLEMKS